MPASQSESLNDYVHAWKLLRQHVGVRRCVEMVWAYDYDAQRGWMVDGS